MTAIEIISILKKKELAFRQTNNFSKHPGIYALFFIGNSFPMTNCDIKTHDIIYVGKTESSQEKRDAKTHFTTGKTGSSTVRKSLGSLLFKSKNLQPIPRNDSDYDEKRFSHFKFDPKSEEIITSWMIDNLALSFYEFTEGKVLLDMLETEIIQTLRPILNIDHNKANIKY